jgi:hypothetical protein
MAMDGFLPVATTSKLPVSKFGEALIETLDLDPLYVGLVGAGLPLDQLYRYLLCYWCFYDVGVAAWMSEQEDAQYWYWMAVAAENRGCPSRGRWPRGAERRHFRGAKCVEAVETLAQLYPKPENAVEALTEHAVCEEVMRAVKTWPMFGNWIAFKVVDMLERCAGVELPIGSDLVLMYQEPFKALEIMALDGVSSPEEHWARILTHFAYFKAPPFGDRFCGPAECETICCKVKSYWGGHYWVGKDIYEQRRAFKGWGDTALRLLEAYPQRLKDDYKYTRH